MYFECYLLSMCFECYLLRLVSWRVKLICFKNCLIFPRWDMSKLLLNVGMIMYWWIIITYHVYYVEVVALLAIYMVRMGTDDNYYICMCYFISCIMMYGLRYGVIFLVKKRRPVTSRWFIMGDQWRVLIQNVGSVMFMVRRGAIGEWTRSIIYL